MRTLARPLAAVAAAFVFVVLCSAGRAVSAQVVGPGQVLISEFRLEGPGGFADEYIEVYCNRDADCDVSGYNIIAYDPSFGDFAISLPDGVVIPARGHLLVGDDAGYTLNSYASLDLVASFGGEGDFFVDNEGIQLRNAEQTVVIDSVGFIGGGAPTGEGDPSTINFIEGAGLQRATGERPDEQYAYVRKMTSATAGRPQDTNNNANDFALVSVAGTPQPGITAPPVLGAPGPENLGAPLQRNAAVPATLVEPAAATTAPPNRVRTGSGNSGTLSLRRSFTNNTGEDITFLIFRVVDITTLNSPGYSPGGPQADLRLVSSGDAETFTNSQGRTVVIRGTALEFDDGENEPNQPNGGGLNSSVAFTDAPIAPGETVDVQFLLNVVQTGNFRFFVNVEAVTGIVEAALAPGVRVSPGLSSNTLRLTPRFAPRRPFVAPQPVGTKTAAPISRRLY